VLRRTNLFEIAPVFRNLRCADRPVLA